MIPVHNELFDINIVTIYAPFIRLNSSQDSIALFLVLFRICVSMRSRTKAKYARQSYKLSSYKSEVVLPSCTSPAQHKKYK